MFHFSSRSTELQSFSAALHGSWQGRKDRRRERADGPRRSACVCVCKAVGRDLLDPPATDGGCRQPPLRARRTPAAAAAGAEEIQNVHTTACTAYAYNNLMGPKAF